MNIKSHRIESIDILRGVVMIIMALDHVRAYFFYESFLGDPTNLETTTPIIFITRFITHFCAPVFIFLAGTSAFLYGSKKTNLELSKFLFTRGVWLVFLELVVNNLIWTFDLSYSLTILQVIWAIGFSMICLSILIFLPKKALLFIGLVLIVGHNLLDSIVAEGNSLKSILWYILHQEQFFLIDTNQLIIIQYPVIPWIGLIILGYLFGSFYKKDYPKEKRKKWLLLLGLGSILTFFILRGLNFYGDLVPWVFQDTISKSILSFFNVSKYPPSLLYICITIGPALLFLYFIESVKNKITDFFLVFGRVPLFYYFLHVFIIHLLAIIGLILLGGDWYHMILTPEVFINRTLTNYGYPLSVVYVLWICVVLLLFPICRLYMIYKASNKDKWWLAYL